MGLELDATDILFDFRVSLFGFLLQITLVEVESSEIRHKRRYQLFVLDILAIDPPHPRMDQYLFYSIQTSQPLFRFLFQQSLKQTFYFW